MKCGIGILTKRFVYNNDTTLYSYTTLTASPELQAFWFRNDLTVGMILLASVAMKLVITSANLLITI